jgi:hypothetical protein
MIQGNAIIYNFTLSLVKNWIILFIESITIDKFQISLFFAVFLLKYENIFSGGGGVRHFNRHIYFGLHLHGIRRLEALKIHF